MAAAQSVPSEVEKSEQEDPVKEVIRWVVKALLQEEEWVLVFDMLEYRNNLSRHQLRHLSELEGREADMTRFGDSFKAGWREWKKRGECSARGIFLCCVPQRHERWGRGARSSRSLKKGKNETV